MPGPIGVDRQFVQQAPIVDPLFDQQAVGRAGHGRSALGELERFLVAALPAAEPAGPEQRLGPRWKCVGRLQVGVDDLLLRVVEFLLQPGHAVEGHEDLVLPVAEVREPQIVFERLFLFAAVPITLRQSECITRDHGRVAFRFPCIAHAAPRARLLMKDRRSSNLRKDERPKLKSASSGVQRVARLLRRRAVRIDSVNPQDALARLTLSS